MKHYSIAIVLFAFAIALINPAYCAVIYSKNDFDPSHYTVWTGQVIFDSKGVTLTPSLQTNKAFIENTNVTRLSIPVYMYYDIKPQWNPSSGSEQTFELFLKHNTTQVSVALVYASTLTKFRLDIDGSKSDVLINGVPETGIIGWDGANAYLYDANGNLKVKITTQQITQPLTGFGFVAYGATVTINNYVLAGDLSTAKTTALKEATTKTVMDFVPLIVALAMMGMALGILKRYT